MLVNCDPASTIYILGDGLTAEHTSMLLHQENHTNTVCVPPHEFLSVPPGSQCMIGFEARVYRRELENRINLDQYLWPTYIHPTATIEPDTTIGKGCYIGPQCYVSFRSTVGDFCRLTVQNLLGHGSKLGSNVVVLPGTTIAGASHIGNHVWFGMRCMVKDKITIVDDCEFALATVIRKDVTQSGRYYSRDSKLVKF